MTHRNSATSLRRRVARPAETIVTPNRLARRQTNFEWPPVKAVELPTKKKSPKITITGSFDDHASVLSTGVLQPEFSSYDQECDPLCWAFVYASIARRPLVAHRCLAAAIQMLPSLEHPTSAVISGIVVGRRDDFNQRSPLGELQRRSGGRFQPRMKADFRGSEFASSDAGSERRARLPEFNGGRSCLTATRQSCRPARRAEKDRGADPRSPA